MMIARLLLAVALLFPLWADAQKISADPTATTLGGGEYLAGVQSAANVKILPSQIATYTKNNLHLINAQTGTSYTYLAADLGKLVTHTNASAIAGTLPQATSSFGAGWFMIVQNTGVGSLTITPTTSTINGASTLVVATGGWGFVVSDGTNYKAAMAGGGGGGLTNFADALATASPNGSTNLASLTAVGSTTDVDFAIRPKGIGAITALIADGGSTNGNKNGGGAVNFQRDLNADSTAVASGTNSFIGNGTGNKNTGTGSFIGNGFLNSVGSVSQGGVVAGRQNSVTSNYGFIGAGQANTASSGNYTVVGGGNQNTASGTAAVVSGGDFNVSSGAYSAIPGGGNNIADSIYSFSVGGSAVSRGMQGALAHSSNNPTTSTQGNRQSRHGTLQGSSTSTTPVILTTDGSSAGSTNQFNLKSDSGLSLHGQVVIRNTSTGTVGRFTVDALFKNVSGTTTLVASTIGAYAGDSALNACTLTAQADNTNSSGQLSFVGLSSTNIAIVFEGWSDEVVN